MSYVHAVAATVAARLGTEFVLLVALAAFVIHERWCPRRRSHARCAFEVLAPIGIGVFVVLATVATIAGTAPESGDTAVANQVAPAAQAALLAFLATFLTSVYRWRATWSWGLVLLCAAAQVSSAQAEPARLLQGWLIGAGLGLAAFAVVRPLRMAVGR